MLDRKIVINELRKRGYIAEEKNVVKNGVLCDGISIHLPETKMENEKVQSVFGVIYMDTLEEMKEMENLSFEQVVERIIEVVWKNSPKLNDFPKNDKEVLKKITIGFQRTEYNSNMLKRKSDFDGIEEYLYIMMISLNILMYQWKAHGEPQKKIRKETALFFQWQIFLKT